MNETPLVSLIMASYNNAAYITYAIDSALAQSYRNIELVIVDDGSTDGTRNILQQYKGYPNIRLNFNDQNRGVGYTKRKCVELASGDICAILDSDDALEVHAVETIVQTYLDNPDAVMVVGGFKYYDAHMESLIKEKWFRFDIQRKSILEHGYAFGWDTFLKSGYVKVGGYDRNQTAEDQDLYFKMEEIGPVVFVDTCMYRYRQHEGGISKKNRRLGVRGDHLKAVESANLRRLAKGDSRVMPKSELSRNWEEFYLQNCRLAFDLGKYSRSYRNLWKSFLVRPHGRLFLKLNLFIHPAKFWLR